MYPAKVEHEKHGSGFFTFVHMPLARILLLPNSDDAAAIPDITTSNYIGVLESASLVFPCDLNSTSG